jgi:hypothetical protein
VSQDFRPKKRMVPPFVTMAHTVAAVQDYHGLKWGESW